MTAFDAVRLALFVLVTVGLVIVSRRSLAEIGSHGFFRFFAWEAIAALILLNLPFWFSDPFSALQLLSWVVLIASLLVLWQGITGLRSGKPTESRTDNGLFRFEKTSELVRSGIYRYIRHPLYASLLYLAWGVFLKEISWQSTTLTLIASLCLVATARADERECVRFFGSSYEEYMRQTKMFIPYLL